MSDILAKLKAAHDARQMVHVHVPEYGLDLYFPPLTVADHEAIRKGVAKGDDHQLMLNGLIRQAHDKAGNRVFDVPVEDKPAVMAELNRMDFDVLQRIIRESSGTLNEAQVAEIGALDLDALRRTLAEAVGKTSALGEGIAAAPDTAIAAGIAAICEAVAARQTVKNG